MAKQSNLRDVSLPSRRKKIETSETPKSEPPMEWEIPTERVTLILDSLQGKFLILLLGYFLSTTVGNVVLLQVGYYLFWIGSFILTVSIFMACETAFFLFLAYRTYKPLADISDWLNRKQEVS